MLHATYSCTLLVYPNCLQVSATLYAGGVILKALLGWDIYFSSAVRRFGLAVAAVFL